MIPENWTRDLKSYQREDSQQSKLSPLSGANRSKSAQAQRERHERRMERDRRFWEEMDE